MKKENSGMTGRWKTLFVSNIKLWIFLAILLIAWGISAGVRREKDFRLQQGISRQVLRFHVLANSDEDADQAVKLQVRDGVLDWLEQKLTAEEQDRLELMSERVEELLPDIEQKASEILRENGFSYGVRAELGSSRFPEKTYGNCTFPAGTYTALRIMLGEAKGHNWWCILFPKLCFLDCVHAVLPQESEKQLQNVLTEEEYESLFDPAEDTYKISFRYF
ncbi:MAG: stage II sporulation protein R [Lachnospiraceae bacterium]|nr:stage II sporulation protein R [Lachnospiraceae bacterium]